MQFAVGGGCDATGLPKVVHAAHRPNVKRLCSIFLLACLLGAPGVCQEPLRGTRALDWDGDIAAKMVGGIDRYLDRATQAAGTNRARWWRYDGSSSTAFFESMQRVATTNRAALRDMLGVTDTRATPSMRFVTRVGAAFADYPGLIARGPAYSVYDVEWTVFRGVVGAGLLLVPEGEPKADIIAVPDCDWTPEQAIGLAPGVPAEQQFPRRFAEAGCRVLIPALVDRGSRFAGNPGVRSVKHSQRETLWRAGYEVGRHPLGYEVQMVLAAADWLDATKAAGPRTASPGQTMRAIQDPGSNRQELGIVGYGEGGLVSYFAGALDTRFLAVGVCGAFGLNTRNAELPVYRNIRGFLDRFDDGELTALVLPRSIIAEHGRYPEVTHTDEGGGAPGRLWRPSAQEFQAAEDWLKRSLPEMAAYFLNGDTNTVCDWGMAQRLYRKLAPAGSISQSLGTPPVPTGTTTDADARTRKLYLGLLEDTQHLMRESEYVRREYWKRADFTSAAAFTNSAEAYRERFRSDVIGEIASPSLKPDPRTRLIYETNGIRGYEVVLDVHPDVFAYGILVVPAGIKAGLRRPVVVCQHGLEGRPSDVANPAIENPAYHRYAYRLAEEGFVTFAPQNAYIGSTRFRQVLRKAQPLGLTLWSFIVPQHEVITDWLAALSFVDPERIAFYGLSYGGKSAMRLPILVKRYCLSICSADYNEWIWKNVSARSPYSYLWTMEYDMPEWNLANTFNYAEMSWLIFPRPFMVERGHDDGVAPDEWVAYEYAKTRRHYMKLGLGDRTEIEFFNGPHSINGQGTFEFLNTHLAK